MFNALRNEINSILNQKRSFATFIEYNVDAANNEAVWKEYKNIAVLSVNYGELKLLTGNRGMSGTMQLQLLMQVEEGTLIEEALSEVIEHLFENSNGVLNIDSDNYNFVLGYHMPTTSGEIKRTQNGIKYIVYTMSVDVAIAKALTLGEQMKVQIYYNNAWVNLENMVSVTITPNVVLSTVTYSNTNISKSDVQSKSFGINIVFTYDGSNTLHSYLYGLIDGEVETPLTVRYGIGEDATLHQRTMVMTPNTTATFPRGEFAAVTLGLTEN